MNSQLDTQNVEKSEETAQARKTWVAPQLELITIKNTGSGDDFDATFGVGSDS